MTSNLDCTICFERYNTVGNKPYLISPCGHCYCKACLDKLKEKTCPECRGNMDSITINRPILKILNEPIHNHIPPVIEELVYYTNVVQEQLDLLRVKQNEKMAECKTRIESLRVKVQQEKAKRLQALEKDSLSLMKELDQIENKCNQDFQNVNEEFSQKKQQIKNEETLSSTMDEIEAKINETGNIQLNFDLREPSLLLQTNLIGIITNFKFTGAQSTNAFGQTKPAITDSIFGSLDANTVGAFLDAKKDPKKIKKCFIFNFWT